MSDGWRVRWWWWWWSWRVIQPRPRVTVILIVWTFFLMWSISQWTVSRSLSLFLLQILSHPLKQILSSDHFPLAPCMIPSPSMYLMRSQNVSPCSFTTFAGINLHHNTQNMYKPQPYWKNEQDSKQIFKLFVSYQLIDPVLEGGSKAWIRLYLQIWKPCNNWDKKKTCFSNKFVC